MKKRKQGYINYIKNPFAQRAVMASGLLIISLILLFLSIRMSVVRGGAGGLNAAATGFSSLIFAGAGLLYAIRSFREKDKNYILSRIGIGVAGMILIFWLVMIMIGLRG